MTSNPLHNLIGNKGFDQYQIGLKSRFMVYQLKYKLVYCEPTDKSAMFLEFESDSQIGRITVWVSGECEMEVIDIDSGEISFNETHHFKSEEEFFNTYPKLVLFMRDSTNV